MIESFYLDTFLKLALLTNGHNKNPWQKCPLCYHGLDGQFPIDFHFDSFASFLPQTTQNQSFVSQFRKEAVPFCNNLGDNLFSKHASITLMEKLGLWSHYRVESDMSKDDIIRYHCEAHRKEFLQLDLLHI